jgi:hypothetical protein
MVDLERSGVYSAKITYSAPSGSEGSRFVVEAGDESLACVVQGTGEPFDYKSFYLGDILVQQAGKLPVAIRPDEELGADLMYFQSLELRPRNR